MLADTPSRELQLEHIAKKHLNIATLAPRNADSLDFKEVSVWAVAAALEAAYEAGRGAR